MSPAIAICPERADHPRVAAAQAALEAAMREHVLKLVLLETGRDPRETVPLYERHDRTQHGPFGGDADNGSTLFHTKARGA